MIVIDLVLLFLAIDCKIWEQNIIEEAQSNIADLNSIITSNEKDKSEKIAYINVQSIPYKFAVYDDITDSYYIVFDDRYMYIVICFWKIIIN